MNFLQFAGVSCALILLLYAAQYNYLLFHSAVESFSILVGCGIFMFAWNTRKYSSNDFFLFLGIAFLFIVLFDFIHTLAYRGMGVFPWDDANLPTQLWIVARYLEGITLLIAPLFLTRRINPRIVFTIFAVITGLIALSISGGFFPDCFITDSGLTPFKKISEYVISLILVSALISISKQKDKLSQSTYRLMLAAIAFTILSELSFTFYISVYGTSNLVGHLFKIVAFYLIYNAVIVNGLKQPYELLQSRESQLQIALSEIKTLRGILPICMYCKKIRVINGDWEVLEKYISEHSEAQFSHGVCEECLEKNLSGE